MEQGHAGAVGEASGEALRLVDAKVGLELLDYGIHEGDFRTTRVGPASVDAGSEQATMARAVFTHHHWQSILVSQAPRRLADPTTNPFAFSAST
jgi:hypothetical protein